MSESTKPNLFDYATKELSQDAMICWLIHWADDRFADTDCELHGCGRRFVQALLHKHGVESLPAEVKTTIYKQEKSIDVLARVSPDHVLLIEDKTGTSDHGDQLRRYYDHVINGDTQLGNVSKEKVYPIYLKTGNQSRSKDRQIEENPENFYKRPYKVFSRNDFLAVLREYKGNHHALQDFRDYLKRWESRTNSFKGWKEDKRSEWSWESWEGFYRYLEDELRTGDWDYVSNPSGGFLGFWWNNIHPNGDRESEIYLVLEADLTNNRHLLCFKVHAPEERRQELKWKWHERILEAGGERVMKPRVMRVGWAMTVGLWNGEWLAFSNGAIDCPGTVANLRVAEEILRSAAEACN